MGRSNSRDTRGNSNANNVSSFSAESEGGGDGGGGAGKGVNHGSSSSKKNGGCDSNSRKGKTEFKAGAKLGASPPQDNKHHHQKIKNSHPPGDSCAAASAAGLLLLSSNTNTGAYGSTDDSSSDGDMGSEDDGDGNNQRCNATTTTASTRSLSSCTYLSLLSRNRPFRLFMTSYTANHVGEWLTYLASISAIEDIQRNAAAAAAAEVGAHEGDMAGTGGTSRTAIAALIIIRLIPNILLCPFGGVLADGWDRRKSMMALDLAGAAVSLMFLLAFYQQSIGLIYLATFLQECVAGLYEPCRSAILPLLVQQQQKQNPDDGSRDLHLATTLAGMAYAVVAAFGSAAGGFLVSVLGIPCCYLVDSLTYLLSAYLMSLVGGKWDVSIDAEGKSTTAESSDTKVADDVVQSVLLSIKEDAKSPVAIGFHMAKDMVWEGCQYLRNSFFGALVLLKFSCALLYGAVDVLNVSYAERKYNDHNTSPAAVVVLVDVGNVEDTPPASSATRLGILFGAAGVGYILGPVLKDYFVAILVSNTSNNKSEENTSFQKVTSYSSVCSSNSSHEQSSTHDNNEENELSDCSPHVLQVSCLVSLAAYAVGCLMMGLYNLPFWMVCLLTVFRAMGASVLWIDSSLLLQIFSLPHMLGRVTSMDYALALLAEALSAWLAGFLQDSGMTPEAVNGWFGVGGLVLTAIWYVYHGAGHGAAGIGKYRPYEEEENESKAAQLTTWIPPPDKKEGPAEELVLLLHV